MIRHFNRFELKYLLTAAAAETLKAELCTRVDPDHYSGEAGYSVLSLYYDSPEFDFYWDKIEGLKFRRKLRLRAYPQANGTLPSQVMVEIKQRINKTVQKRRIRLPLQAALQLCTAQAQLSARDAFEANVISEVQYLVSAKQLRPSCLIRYHRQAWQGREWHPGLRITFDTELKARVQDLQLSAHAADSYFLPPDQCILEVKVDERVPDWLASLLSKHECQLKRVSKYCTGLAHCHGLAPTQRRIRSEK